MKSQVVQECRPSHYAGSSWSIKVRFLLSIDRLSFGISVLTSLGERISTHHMASFVVGIPLSRYIQDRQIPVVGPIVESRAKPVCLPPVSLLYVLSLYSPTRPLPLPPCAPTSFLPSLTRNEGGRARRKLMLKQRMKGKCIDLIRVLQRFLPI